jgi:putative DNA primase/helicase
MQHDGKINIATGHSASSKVWKNKTWNWSDFVAKVREPYHTNETFKEFIAASKADQCKIKDIGGYVGAYLRGGKRSPGNVAHRQLATLDIDFAHLDFWDDFTLMFGCAAILHGTHKHSEASPRYRLLIPLSREASPDEYVAVSRNIAGLLGIELFDKTTFETNRLMFWPSTPKDVEYYFEFQDGPWLDVDSTLATYIDWKDTTLWPTADRELKDYAGVVDKQQDPHEKAGIVGAFCRTYTISEAIQTFLSEEYEPTLDDKRYTYTKGTTSAGLMVYDDTFAYSHHGTDPCSGKTCNAFDLVRLHKFGHLDNDGATSQKPKSFAAMEDFARADKEVRNTIAAEVLQDAKYDYFVDDFEDTLNVEGDQDNIEWMSELEADSKNKYLSSATNINTIFNNDPRLKAIFRRNDFDGKRYVFASLPWRKVTTPEPIKDVDYSGLRNYIESVYGIAGSLKVDDSLALQFEKHSFHPIKDYLRGLTWDGTGRIDTLLIEYFGCVDNIYTRESMRKFLIAAVKRIFVPGCKFDNVLTVVGPQGTYKSTFFKKLGKDWHSDTFTTVQGKEAFEQLSGHWLIEMAELAGIRKAEVEAVKHFTSKQEDSFRAAYGREPIVYKRQCVFAATTNKKDFLNDPSGNRRFWPADVIKERRTKSVWDDLDSEVNQIWAEAMHYFKAGEALYLSDAAEQLAKDEQRNHSETDERTGLILDYLNARLPDNWDSLDIYDRRSHLDNDKAIKKGRLRDYVCMAEIWCECLGKNKEDMSRYNTREINDIMKSLEGWEYHATTKNFGYYGKQKYYSRSYEL